MISVVSFGLLILLVRIARFYCNYYDVNAFSDGLTCRTRENGTPVFIQFVMYYTNTIQDYSQLAVNINARYSRIYQIEMIVIDEHSDQSFDKVDVRWNKVKIISNLLANRRHSQTKYFIWLDSDLVFIDFTFNLTNYLLNLEQYDLLLSREINPANGIANTGSMIVKNTDWSREFFEKWWNFCDHSLAMDQHAFQNLYYNLPLEDRQQRIHLLPENSINSRFPGLWTHRDEDPILHLAGESNFIRKVILEKINDNINTFYQSESENDGISPPIRPFITRQELDSIDYIGIHLEEWHQIDLFLKELQFRSKEVLSLTLHDVYQVRNFALSSSKFLLK